MTINGHGIVTVGKTIDEATINAIYMERTAKMEHAARQMGFEGVTIEHEEMLEYNRSKMAEQGRSISRPKTNHSDEWRDYRRKIERGQPWNRGWT